MRVAPVPGRSAGCSPAARTGRHGGTAAPGRAAMQHERPIRSFVSVLPVNARGEILLHLRDDRPGLDGANTWSTLGGLIEPGESAEETARRELLEECGRTVERLVP